MLEERDPALELERIDGERREGRLVVAPGSDRRRDRRPLGGMPAEAVEQLALPAFVEQPTLVTLPVDLHERPGNGGQAARGDGLVVEPRHRPAVGPDLAHAHERLREPVEERLDARCFGAVADEARVRAGAEGKPERVDEEALPGAGLAGQDVEPLGEGDPGALDQGQVGHRQLEEAPGGEPRTARLLHAQDGRSCAFWRSRSQNGSAPSGSRNRTGRGSAATVTMSPTES